MKNSVRISLKLSELRQSINDFDQETGAAEDLDQLTAEYRQAETEYRAAVVVEDVDQGPARNGQDGEAAELRRLRDSAKFGMYIAASAARRGVTGAEAELNAALGIPELGFPLDFLGLPEQRAAIVGDGQENQGTWLDRVFHDSAAMRLGVTFPAVEAGISAYPVTTSGGVSQQRGITEAATARTFAVSVTEAKPTRRALHFVYSLEDAARLPGLADAIQRDMRAAMVEDIDRAIFLGDSGAAGTDADIVGLNTAAITEMDVTQANKIKGPETLEEFVKLIDGKYAASAADVQIVAAEGANKLWMITLINSAASNETMAEFLRRGGFNWTVRGDIETNSANNDFGAFIGLARGIDGAARAPVWMGANLITDPYSGAEKGEVQLTLSYLWNFVIPRPDNFRRLKFVT